MNTAIQFTERELHLIDMALNERANRLEREGVKLRATGRRDDAWSKFNASDEARDLSHKICGVIVPGPSDSELLDWLAEKCAYVVTNDVDPHMFPVDRESIRDAVKKLQERESQ